MRIGFASIFSYRPHAEHVYYLSLLARSAGHDVRFLTCDAQLASCYTRELKGKNAWIECPKCMLGGLRSYAAGVTSLSSGHATLAPERASDLAVTSAATVLRTEAPGDLIGTEFAALREALALGVARAYEGARQWIGRERLDALVCFNGRLDATRGVCEAARDAGIPFLTVERTWFGDGLQFAVNDSSLDLSQLDRLNAEYRQRPLTAVQGHRVARHLAARFLRRNDLEWRSYNRQAQPVKWPAARIGSGPRVLIAPSSRNEVEGHPHWVHRWGELADGLDATLAALHADPGSAVLRCHPNWGERIGRSTGERSEQYYTAWAGCHGATVIASRDRASTLDLIASADVIVVTGGSAAFEAAALGKPVVSLTPAAYQSAGIGAIVTGSAGLSAIDEALNVNPSDRTRRALRYGYTHGYRFSQFVDYVRAVTTTQYRYFNGANFSRMEQALVSGELPSDDAAIAIDTAAEDAIVDKINARAWEVLHANQEPAMAGAEIFVRRRPTLRWVDSMRGLFPKGDL